MLACSHPVSWLLFVCRSKSIDWGISQLDAVIDRHEITGSHFLVLTNFGDHGLHHLFPTIDHGKLNYLYPTFKQVCAKFGVELRMASQLDMMKGTFKQLANTTPNPLPPGHKLNWTEQVQLHRDIIVLVW